MPQGLRDRQTGGIFGNPCVQRSEARQFNDRQGDSDASTSGTTPRSNSTLAADLKALSESYPSAPEVTTPRGVKDSRVRRSSRRLPTTTDASNRATAPKNGSHKRSRDFSTESRASKRPCLRGNSGSEFRSARLAAAAAAAAASSSGSARRSASSSSFRSSTTLTMPGASSSSRARRGAPPGGRNVCGKCGKSFSSSNRLEIHMRSHSGEKPFVCGVCGSRFTQNCHLRRHMDIHENKFRFSCSLCLHNFKQNSNLEKHFNRHGKTDSSLFVAPGDRPGREAVIDQLREQLANARLSPDAERLVFAKANEDQVWERMLDPKFLHSFLASAGRKPSAAASAAAAASKVSASPMRRRTRLSTTAAAAATRETVTAQQPRSRRRRRRGGSSAPAPVSEDESDFSQQEDTATGPQSSPLLDLGNSAAALDLHSCASDASTVHDLDSPFVVHTKPEDGLKLGNTMMTAATAQFAALGLPVPPPPAAAVFNSDSLLDTSFHQDAWEAADGRPRSCPPSPTFAAAPAVVSNVVAAAAATGTSPCPSSSPLHDGSSDLVSLEDPKNCGSSVSDCEDGIHGEHDFGFLMGGAAADRPCPTFAADRDLEAEAREPELQPGGMSSFPTDLRPFDDATAPVGVMALDLPPERRTGEFLQFRRV